MTESTPLSTSRRRLQRDKDFTGDRLSRFREVFLRHGLPGLTLGLLFLTQPDLRTLFLESIADGLADPARYALICAAIFFMLNAYAWWIDRQWHVAKLAWIIYLGALSFWEEWVFRVALPDILIGWGTANWFAIIFSAALFGGAHYFTLRWQWPWCFGAFIGALALSRQMNIHNDLLLITAFHWIATYVNTPRPPGPAGQNVVPKTLQ